MHTDPSVEAADQAYPTHSTFEAEGDQPQGRPRQHDTVRVYSWNIGGKPVQDALKAIEISKTSTDTVACFQELPRTQAGWQTTIINDVYTLVQYRDDLRQWRGNGILFRTGTFKCLRRKANHVGVWVKLRHSETQTEMWVGSVRLSTGVTDDITAEEIQDFLRLRPARPHQVVLMADYNTRLSWTAGGGPRGHVRPTTGRADNLVTELEGRGLQMCPPRRNTSGRYQPADPEELVQGVDRSTGRRSQGSRFLRLPLRNVATGR